MALSRNNTIPRSRFAATTTPLKPPKPTILLQAFESFMLIALTTSFLLQKFIPSLNESVLLTKYLQFYTSFFIGYESVIKCYEFYQEYKNTKIDPNSLLKNPFFLKSIGFLLSFIVSIIGLLPIDINRLNVGPLLLATSLATFPYKLVDLVFNGVDFRDIIFCVFNAALFLASVGLYFFKDYNCFGYVLLLSLLSLGVNLAVGVYNRSRNVDRKVVEHKVLKSLGIMLHLAVVLGLLAMYLRQIELGMPMDLAFLKPKTN